jgi:hypothetical protein
MMSYCYSTKGLGFINSLVHLNISSNQIKIIEGLETLSNLETLLINNNQISTTLDLRALTFNTSLKKLDISCNQVCKQQGYRSIIIQLVPSLHELDGIKISNKNSKLAYNIIHRQRNNPDEPGNYSEIYEKSSTKHYSDGGFFLTAAMISSQNQSNARNLNTIALPVPPSEATLASSPKSLRRTDRVHVSATPVIPNRTAMKSLASVMTDTTLSSDANSELFDDDIFDMETPSPQKSVLESLPWRKPPPNTIIPRKPFTMTPLKARNPGESDDGTGRRRPTYKVFHSETSPSTTRAKQDDEDSVDPAASIVSYNYAISRNHTTLPPQTKARVIQRTAWISPQLALDKQPEVAQEMMKLSSLAEQEVAVAAGQYMASLSQLEIPTSDPSTTKSHTTKNESPARQLIAFGPSPLSSSMKVKAPSTATPHVDRNLRKPITNASISMQTAPSPIPSSSYYRVDDSANDLGNDEMIEFAINEMLKEAATRDTKKSAPKMSAYAILRQMQDSFHADDAKAEISSNSPKTSNSSTSTSGSPFQHFHHTGSIAGSPPNRAQQVTTPAATRISSNQMPTSATGSRGDNGSLGQSESQRLNEALQALMARKQETLRMLNQAKLVERQLS